MKKSIILASSSPYRRELLKRLFDDFEILSPDIDERSVFEASPKQLAIRLAQLKARAVKEQTSGNHIIIASDQIAVLDDKPLHKPGDRETHIHQLTASSGKQVNFYTSVYVIGGDLEYQDCDITSVQFRNLSDRQITRYVDKEPALDCAGGFKVEGLGISLFESVKTEDPNALIGLPLIKLCSILNQVGLDLP